MDVVADEFAFLLDGGLFEDGFKAFERLGGAAADVGDRRKRGRPVLEGGEFGQGGFVFGSEGVGFGVKADLVQLGPTTPLPVPHIRRHIAA